MKLAVGTMKGAFLLSSDDRERWTFEGPLFKGWIVSAFAQAPDGTYLAATGSSWYGAAIHRSTDLTDWAQTVNGPSYQESQDRKLSQIWRIVQDGVLYAGVDEAGLFSSADAESWDPVVGINEHETRPGWSPGAGGLCAHAILTDRQSNRLWCGISSVGVFRSDDGGANWTPHNDGVPKTQENEEYPDIGYCVHALVSDPLNASQIWRQDHQGVFRTRDGAESWERIEEGLPAAFGFALAMDEPTRSLFVIPMESDEYRLPVDGTLRVFRSRDDGDSWEASDDGLPESVSYTGVLRGAISADGDGGIYFGTTAGTLHYTINAGESWDTLPYVLPRILAVHAFPD